MDVLKERTTGSDSFAASSSVTLFCTKFRLLRNGDGKAWGEE